VIHIQNKEIRQHLLTKGVHMPFPESVHIGDDVNPERISQTGVILYPGVRVLGSSTFIAGGAQLGSEGPVVLDNCFVGPGVKLKAGYFYRSVFLKGSSLGSGAHVREGTIFEEQASAAHGVGVKQTILFPYVTLGSLINFCDCLMAGGTSREDHSEVGSSYIHFNYTPNQDKATPSLLGDVPRGVMLNQPPIFLGGQGGLVGPCRLTFGTVVAAGTIIRKDELRSSRFIFEGQPRSGNIAYVSGNFRGIKRIITNNLTYIANLVALRQWYRLIRPLFSSEDLPPLLLRGLVETLDLNIAERIHRLGHLCMKLSESADHLQTPPQSNHHDLIRQKFEVFNKWHELKTFLDGQTDFTGNEHAGDQFFKTINSAISGKGKDYLHVIKGLSREQSLFGTDWLNGIVSHVLEGALEIIPSCK
jgi:bifunctional UDP-N-acetylglucosamine pyrophosphorylase / glucosamine-1-phosphate N-acetyltransferase